MTEHVLITGAANGIGLHTALLYAARSATVTLVDFDAAKIESAAARVAAAGASKVHRIIADLRSPSAPAEIVRSAWSITPVDILVNSAGVYPSTPFLEITAAIWDSVQHINVRAPLLATVELGKLARNSGRRASVVNISSTAALRTRPGAAPYSTSKSAVEMMTKASALELGQWGVRVNAISPGFVPVDSSANPVTKQYAASVSKNPLGRSGTADDIARAIVWIASDEAGWVTGSIFKVDGGSSTGSHSLPLSWDSTALDG
jgi:NAD(P)-dependent dehydrogenase (short-subunit alcohol dehydrogenase family)